jgi:hypothetical protein
MRTQRAVTVADYHTDTPLAGHRHGQPAGRDPERPVAAVIEVSDKFSYDNSLALGRRMTADFSKLMLRAYNAGSGQLRLLRAGALAAATKRLGTSASTIARLGKMMEMRAAPEYHALRITELELTADDLFKQQEEREAAREERERCG